MMEHFSKFKIWVPISQLLVVGHNFLLILDNIIDVVSMGESARLAPSSSFYVVTSAILGCKSFKIGGNFWIILLKSYKSKDLTSFLD